MNRHFLPLGLGMAVMAGAVAAWSGEAPTPWQRGDEEGLGAGKALIAASNRLVRSNPAVPFLFSRNLDISHLDEAGAEALRDVPAYGKKGVPAFYAARFGGRATFIPAERIAAEFNPTGATNGMIRP